MGRRPSFLTWSHISIRILPPVKQAHLVHGVSGRKELCEQAHLEGRERDKREAEGGEDVEPDLALHAEETALLIDEQAEKTSGVPKGARVEPRSWKRTRPPSSFANKPKHSFAVSPGEPTLGFSIWRHSGLHSTTSLTNFCGLGGVVIHISQAKHSIGDPRRCSRAVGLPLSRRAAVRVLILLLAPGIRQVFDHSSKDAEEDETLKDEQASTS